MNLDLKTKQLTEFLGPNAAQTQHQLQQQYQRTYLLRTSSEFIFVILLQFAGIKLQHQIPLAFGSAINLIVLCWRGPRVLPAMFIGCFFVLWFSNHHWLFALLNGLLLIAQPIAIVALLKWFNTPAIPLLTRKDRQYFCLSVMLVSVLSACFYERLYGHVFTIALLSLLNGFLLITPANIIWGGYPQPLRQYSLKQRIIAGCHFFLLSAVSYITLVSPSPIYPLISFTILYIPILVSRDHYVISVCNLILILSLLPYYLHVSGQVSPAYYPFSLILLISSTLAYSFSSSRTERN